MNSSFELSPITPLPKSPYESFDPGLFYLSTFNDSLPKEPWTYPDPVESEGLLQFNDIIEDYMEYRDVENVLITQTHPTQPLTTNMTSFKVEFSGTPVEQSPTLTVNPMQDYPKRNSLSQKGQTKNKSTRDITSSISEKTLKGGWTEDEDIAVIEGVEFYGKRKWRIIALKFLKGTRNGKQCRERYLNHLDPTVNKEPYSDDEIAKIYKLYSELGSQWSKMAKQLPGRTANSIKNFYNGKLRSKKVKF